MTAVHVRTRDVRRMEHVPQRARASARVRVHLRASVSRLFVGTQMQQQRMRARRSTRDNGGSDIVWMGPGTYACSNARGGVAPAWHSAHLPWQKDSSQSSFCQGECVRDALTGNYCRSTARRLAFVRSLRWQAFRAFHQRVASVTQVSMHSRMHTNTLPRAPPRAYDHRARGHTHSDDRLQRQRTHE